MLAFGSNIFKNEPLPLCVKGTGAYFTQRRKKLSAKGEKVVGKLSNKKDNNSYT
jgi:hypothetical protein